MPAQHGLCRNTKNKWLLFMQVLDHERLRDALNNESVGQEPLKLCWSLQPLHNLIFKSQRTV